MRRSRSRWVLLLISSLVLLVTLAAPAMAAPGGNSANVKLCQKGGWEDLQRADDTPFSSLESCVAYAAQGGTPEPIPVGPVVSLASTGPYTVAGYCATTISFQDFAPNAVIHYQIVNATTESTVFGGFPPINSEGDGSYPNIPLLPGTYFARVTLDLTTYTIFSAETAIAC